MDIDELAGKIEDFFSEYEWWVYGIGGLVASMSVAGFVMIMILHFRGIA